MAIPPKPSGNMAENADADERPPILSSWKQIYAIVLILHALIILMFYLFTHAYA
ncbi:hypothetical protein [Flavilitoribacter nigricans]|uniref:hypothetical protein n=1 Tax=Flavilitoribacter nigricans TaxID=70997 RepID=UPI001475F3F3|nr:hypothetical protein [Flavilitoribacter nigricans]